MSVWDHKFSKNQDKPKSRRRRSSAGNIENHKDPKPSSLRAVIVDNGAYSIKVGHSTQKEPKLVPNCIVKAKSERKRLFIGSQIDECRDCSGLYFLLPCEKGYITKWEVQKPIWDFVFGKNLCPVSDSPVILTQPLFNFKSIQDCTDEIFFEEYEVPSLFRLNPTDLARLRYVEEFGLAEDACCLIIDTGYSFTHIIPYIKGNKYLRGVKRINVGGKLLTNHLKDIISYRQYNVMEETYVINQVKEDTCYVCEDIKNELSEASKPSSVNKIKRNYVLPDFNTIRRGYIHKSTESSQDLEENCQILTLNNERFIVPEILFHPSDIGMKSMGIAEAAIKSIFSCPKDSQPSLAKNIVLVGGNCNFSGFKDRIYAELRSLLPDSWEVKVYQPSDPVTYSWKGGSQLLKTPNFKTYLVTKEEYEELGSSIIQQRFNMFMSDNTQEEEEPKIIHQDFSYLEKLKSGAIFGKQDPSEGASDSKTDNVTGISSQTDSNSSSEKEATSNTSEETSQDSMASLETDLNAKTPRKVVGKGRLKTAEAFQPEDQGEEDLLQSVELFPFGTDSYL